MSEALKQLNDAFDKWKLKQEEKLNLLREENAKNLDRIEELEAKRAGPTRVSGESRERKNFNGFLKTNNHELLEEKTMSIAGGESAGAGTLTTIIANEVQQTAVKEEPVVGEVRITNVQSGDYRRVVNRKGTSSGWVSETGTRNNTNTSAYRNVVPVGGELYAYPSASNWMLQDSQFDVAQLVIDDVGEEFGMQMGNSILFGTGTDQPWGLLKNTPVATADAIPDLRDKDTLRYLTGAGSPNVLDADLLIDTLFDLNAGYRRNAIWVMNSYTLGFVRKLKDNTGSYLWQANIGAAVDSGDGTLLGKRVVVSERMQNVGAGSGAFPILCGDFRRGYELVNVGGIFITRDEVTQPGFTKWYTRRRVLGRIADNNAIRVIRD